MRCSQASLCWKRSENILSTLEIRIKIQDMQRISDNAGLTFCRIMLPLIRWTTSYHKLLRVKTRE
uniref:Uncharacterized protein n=1 Tax=Arundo donax TaxID=35708 RepID=A0A0A8ZXZ9_ARUDO